jgi:hypothetical protein
MQLRGRIRAYLNRDPGFSTRMLQSYHNFMRGETVPFVKVLEDFFRTRVTRTLMVTDESNLEMAIELLWFEEAQCVPQLCLVMDFTKHWGEGRGGFVDIFVGNSLRRISSANPIIVLELKHLTLRGLWKAQQRKPDLESTSSKDYAPIVTMLRDANEDQLLAMKYTYYDEEKHKWITLRVRDVLQEATAQVNKYIGIISMGPVTTAHSVVLDARITCCDGGCDILFGYVIICIGGTRGLCRLTMTKTTAYSFEVVDSRL